MAPRDDAREGHWTGVLVLLSLIVHFGAGSSNERPIELLWCCYASSIVLGLSILVSWQPGISAASVFQVGVGVPMYLLDIFAGGTTGSRTLTAAIAHLVPPLVGLRQLSRSGLSPYAWLGAAALLALTQHLALATDPRLNINLAHAPWEPVAAWFDSMWLYRTANLLGATALCYAADRVLRAYVVGSAQGAGR